MKKFLAMAALLILVGCQPGPSLFIQDAVYPLKVLSVSHGVREDVGFNGTKFTAASWTTVLFIDARGKFYRIEEAWNLEFVKDQIIEKPQEAR